MAQSIGYWYDIIVTEKQSFASLNVYLPNPDTYQTFLVDLKSSSRVARWRLLVWCVAVAIYSFDVLLSLFRIEMTAMIAKGKYGTLPWYPVMAKEFQYGDTLTWTGTEFAYPVIDPNKQIIKRAAASSAPGTVILKIAKYVAGVNTKLNVAEEAAALVYFNQRVPPGIIFNLINTDPDEIKTYMKIYVDPSLLNPATGEMIATPGTFPAEDAAKGYIDSLNDAFNGVFEMDKYINAIQNAVGVTDVYLISAAARTGVIAYAAFTENYTPYSGHFTIGAGFALNTTFTYLPNN